MKKALKWAIPVVLALILTGGYWAHTYWKAINDPTVQMDGYALIHTGSDYDEALNALVEQGIVRDIESLRWVADKKNYTSHVHPGRYKVEKGMSNAQLIDLLRSGEQTPVMVTFNNFRRLDKLADKVSSYLELPADQFQAAFEDPATWSKYGLARETFPAIFIPNSYEMWWNTTPERFVERMAKEHQRFWTERRKQKARGLGLTEVQVSTLASIVEEETIKLDEAPRIAGVYINRLRINMPLQADPTLKFALGKDSIARVLDADKLVDSPYNTYIHTGLPPGPIRIPDPRYIDAVLDHEVHKFLYFCAKEDLSGYSNFASNYSQHLANARRYQRELDRRGIYR